MASSISCGTRFFSTLAADFLQGQFAALVVELLEPVEAVAAVTHHFTGLADIAELLGELQQADFGTDDLLFRRHGVLQCAEAGRFVTPTAPRPASAYDSPWGQDTSVRLSFGYCIFIVGQTKPRCPFNDLTLRISRLEFRHPSVCFLLRGFCFMAPSHLACALCRSGYSLCDAATRTRRLPSTCRFREMLRVEPIPENSESDNP
jgi:hypothetical protein